MRSTARSLVKESRSIHRTASTISTGIVLIFDKVNYFTLRNLRQQTPKAVCRRAYNLGPNRARLPELNQEAVKVQPLHIICFSNGLPDVGTSAEEGRTVRDANLDLSKISVFGSDGLECRSDPPDGPRIEPKHQIFEFRRLREVDRGWYRLT